MSISFRANLAFKSARIASTSSALISCKIGPLRLIKRGPLRRTKLIRKNTAPRRRAPARFRRVRRTTLLFRLPLPHARSRAEGGTVVGMFPPNRAPFYRYRGPARRAPGQTPLPARLSGDFRRAPRKGPGRAFRRVNRHESRCAGRVTPSGIVALLLVG